MVEGRKGGKGTWRRARRGKVEIKVSGREGSCREREGPKLVGWKKGRVLWWGEGGMKLGGKEGKKVIADYLGFALEKTSVPFG